MDENIFGGAPVNPQEPQNEENKNVENPVENIPSDVQQFNQPEQKLMNPGEYHYNAQQYDNVQQTTEENVQVTQMGYTPLFGQNNPVNPQPMYQGYSQPVNAQPVNNQQMNIQPVNNQPQENQNPYAYTPYGNNGAGFEQPPVAQPQMNQSPFMQPAVPPKKKNPGLKVFVGIIIGIVVIVAVLMVALFAGEGTTDSVSPDSSVNNTETNEPIDNVEDVTLSESSNVVGDAVTVARVAKPFNVGILVYSKNQLYTEGSGVIIKEDSDGKYTYIVTCAHVVNYSGVALSVLLEDGTEYPADLVGMDTRTDLAVVRIEANGLPKAEIADSDQLLVGQTIYAVGNPGGSEFFGSVTDGIISAIGRPVSSGTGYEMECIQHTSAINPGNSGGALVNGKGQLVGINSMKIASTEYEGMGFAVPSSVMVEVFNSIIENGYVAGRAKLGIQYATPSNYSQTYAMYVQMKGLPTGTIVIASVSEDSSLYGQDVKEGDMIVAVNGKDMTYSDMLADMIEDMSAGDTLTLTIVRVNTDDWTQTEREVTVTLVEDTGSSGAQVPETNGNSGVPSGEDYEDWYDFFKDFYGY